MIATVVGFLAMLNPFALFLYLTPVMRELDGKQFDRVVLKASAISFGISFFFFLTGDFIFKYILHISFDSFRVFGGIVIFSFAYLYLVRGQRAMISMKTDLNELASEISLPFMVGAGTISLAIVMADDGYSLIEGLLLLLVIFTINYLFIVFLRLLRSHIERRKFRVAFDKNMEILLRLSGFFIGAIGVDMIITGLRYIISGGGV
ncbi:MAG: MarC family protein [Lentisphaeria bacterium]